MVDLSHGEAFAELAAQEQRLMRAETASVVFVHIVRWTMVVAALVLLVVTDFGGWSSLSAAALDAGERLGLAGLSLAVAGWIGWSNYRRQRELIDIEHRFLQIEIQALRRSGDG